MTTVCRYCNALKFKRETAGLCCASGKVKLDPLLTPPQPLKALFDGNDPDSSHFLQHILEYNNCFRMTSFGAHIIREGGFMPTCKVKDTTHTIKSYTIFFNKWLFAITDTRTNISFAWFNGANTRWTASISANIFHFVDGGSAECAVQYTGNRTVKETNYWTVASIFSR